MSAGAKKRRLSMLAGLSAAPTAPSGASGADPAPEPSGRHRALRAARDAVDGHRIWDLDPDAIRDRRTADRLDPGDVAELRASIEASGQAVPILVRRDPSEEGRYLLVYGRRRLEAIRGSQSVHRVRALVATMGDGEATRAQAAENAGRRDLSYIEKALFARELLDTGFGTQAEVAEVLAATKSTVSMALGIVDALGTDLIRIVGPAPGIGRPRWDKVAAAVRSGTVSRDALRDAAARVDADGPSDADGEHRSLARFGAIARLAQPPLRRGGAKRRVDLGPDGAASVRRTASGLQLDLPAGALADWIDANAAEAIGLLRSEMERRGSQV